MHRIGIISDTHGLLRPEVMETLQGCDVILHAGDMDRQNVLDRLKSLMKPLYAVRGNADGDWARNLPGELTVELFGRRFHMIHNIREISPEAGSADFIVYGHSHKYFREEKAGQIRLNPGSCGRRRFALPVTMAVVELEEDGSYRIVRRDIAGEKAAPNCGPMDLAAAVKAVIKEFNRGRPPADIAARGGISLELAEQICRMYTTHPGIDVDGILNRIAE